MRSSIAVKFIAFFLTALSLIVAVAGGAGIVLMETSGLYNNTLEDQKQEWYDNAGKYIAWEYACRYTAKYMGGCSEALLDRLYETNYYGMGSEYWHAELFYNGSRVDQTINVIENPIIREYTFTVEYPVASREKPEIEDEAEKKPLYTSRYTIWENGEMAEYYLSYYQGPEFTVALQMHPNLTQRTLTASLTNLYPYRYALIMVLLTGFLGFSAGMVWLCRMAGMNSKKELSPGGLNLIPLDVYACLSAAGILLLLRGLFDLYYWGSQYGLNLANMTLLALCTFSIALLLLGFLFALAAQCKLPKFYWLRHTAICFALIQLWRLLVLLLKGLRAVFCMLPAIWQWLIGTLLLGGCTLVSFVFSVTSFGTAAIIANIVFALCGTALLVSLLYSGFAFGVLLLGARKMTRGTLSYQIPTRHLHGIFFDFAVQLNQLSETAMLSAKHQLKSERMKTELITNISHDIKTPLTSIISFVDLLQKPHSKDDEQQYLDVLARQSVRMKKLIEDLVELSRANSGSITDNRENIDAVEAVNQALGEFSDKLENADITAVFHHPDTRVEMFADGRLVWRVLSNLISNAIKYAMPGTRLFMDLRQDQDEVILSLKNISREPLTRSSDDLLERFVRGDSSRTTEGSGLGLNIAKSLMEVQRGRLELTLDGDVFKVDLYFPKAERS